MCSASLLTHISFLPLLLALPLEAVEPVHANLHPVAPPPALRSELTITQATAPGRPFTVTGERGAILGYQSGEFEAWLFPVKVLRHFRIAAELAGYGVPLELNQLASVIQVSPSETVITYSHAALTVRQHMLAPRGGDNPAGALVLFEIDSVRPVRLSFRFEPVVARMWPAAGAGIPGPEWIAAGASGYYKLHTDDAGLTAAVALPGAQPGVIMPYQERPAAHPLEFHLDYTPKSDRGKLYPLLLALGRESDDFDVRLRALNDAVPELWAQTRERFRDFLARSVQIETPDGEFNRAMRWAEVATEQARVRFHEETGVTAGFAPSGDSLRPGFGWFFGRDTLWSLYAVDLYGDFAASRHAFEFLLARQRADGKIMHEFSQTADLVDWKATPYFYASADSTPLLVMAMEDYVRASGDLAFLRLHWEQVKRAYAFARAQDSDHDGIMENTAGTGWVESWPSSMPHQEIYLAALDQQSAGAMSRLAGLMGDVTLAASAAETAGRIRAAILASYPTPDGGFYAFSRNADGTLDRTTSIYPAVAWWDGRLRLDNALPMLERWASHEFSTDWGTRDIGANTSFYDPISYHQGSVWPLFTAWVALAEYRSRQPLSAYAHLRQNAGLTYVEDLGGVTELLSGDLFEPLARSSTHQTWSSAMTLSVALRGLFGLDPDAPNRRLRLAPQLPAQWDYAALHHLRLGAAEFDLDLVRQGGNLVVRAHSRQPQVLCLDDGAAPRSSQACASAPATIHELRLALPPVEPGLEPHLPLAGSRTTMLKALSFVVYGTRATLLLEAPGGSTQSLPVRFNRTAVSVSGASVEQDRLLVPFPAGDGYRRTQVEFSW
jgi:glycogen debranching enzyme